MVEVSLGDCDEQGSENGYENDLVDKRRVQVDHDDRTAGRGKSHDHDHERQKSPLLGLCV